MKVLVLDTLLKQTISQEDLLKKEISKEDISKKEVIKSIYNEYETFADLEKQGKNTIAAYLRKQNGKAMQGAENIWKYRLNDGDRILYTYGKYLKYLRTEDADSLVLLSYAHHDKQGLIAKNKKFFDPHDYTSVTEITNMMKTLDINLQALEEEGFAIEDLYTITQILFDQATIQDHVIYVATDETLANTSSKNLDVLLSDEQDNCIKTYMNTNKPTLILGGGGCGKTLIAIHLLKKFNSKAKLKNIYFTQSQELRNKVEKQYYDIVENSSNVTEPDVKDINDFCIEHLGLRYKNFIKTPKHFLDFIKQNETNPIIKNCLKQKIFFNDLWAEIRGTIKGSMHSLIPGCSKWKRLIFANQQDFGNLSNLKKRNYPLT